MGVQLDGPVGVGSEGGLAGGQLQQQVLQLLLLLLRSSLDLTWKLRVREVEVVAVGELRLFMDPWWPRAIYLNMQNYKPARHLTDNEPELIMITGEK